MTLAGSTATLRPDFLGANLPALLRAQLSGPLPGREAQSAFEPDSAFGRHFSPPQTTSRAASVLILLYPREGIWHIPLTIRPQGLTSHGGQISLPGGSVDGGETSDAAALRELHEEIGVVAPQCALVGRLSPINLFSTQFFVTPWLARLDETPLFHLNSAEVAGLIELPLAGMLDRRTWGSHRREIRGTTQLVPHIEYGDHRIWGATAMILGELCVVCEQALNAAANGRNAL